MGLISGRDGRGTRRTGGGHASDGQRYTSLIGDSQRGANRAGDGHGDQPGYGQPDSYSQPGAHGPSGEYAGPGGYSQHDGYGPSGEYGRPGGYGQHDGYGPSGEYGLPGDDGHAGEYGPSRENGRPGGDTQRGRPGVPAGRALSAELDLGEGLDAGRGPRVGRGAAGSVAAFLPGSGRAGSRRHGSRRGTLSVPVMSVVALIASLALVAAALGVTHMLTGQNAADAAPAVDMNCSLIVPANPLSAQGLATPYQLTATDAAAGPCNEANANQTAFVQGAIIDPATGAISIYDPLVVDAGTQPATAPVAPTLPAGAIVALWFGFNGNTLSLVGADQAQSVLNQATASATASAGSTVTATPTTTPTTTPSQAQTGAAATATAAPTGTATGTAPASDPTTTGPATTTPAQDSQSTATPSTPATATAAFTGSAPRAAVEDAGSAPLPPAGSSGQYDGTMSHLAGYGSGQAGQAGNGWHPGSPSATSSAAATSPASGSATTPASPTTAPSGSAPWTATPSASTGNQGDPPVSAGDSPAASGTPDPILQQANCVAGENIGGQFSSFTQVGACNGVAFFAAANAAIQAGKLTVPQPGIAKDGQRCLTTRSFALIDQDQSDNVTTEYLAEPNGQTAQDTAANRQALGGASTLFNGSDNGLLDLFVDPALGCSPWEVPNLADGGAPAPSLPLDELQAAAWAGKDNSGPAALVPLNDPMTLDGNGNFSTDKTNTYRSIVDMPALPVGESPAAYCSDMEQIQGQRLQQDVNLLTGAPSPMPAAAANLFDFMAMRLQQSFMNLNCGNFGQQNDVSTSVDGNGVVVAACFLRQFAPVTSGPGNPAAGQQVCQATVTSAPSGASTPTAAPGMPSAKPSSGAPGSSYHRHHRQHWWW